MGEKEDKEKAEKLAAAKKRVAQLQKKKKAAGGSVAGEKSSKDKAKAPKDETPKSPTKDNADADDAEKADGEVEEKDIPATTAVEAENHTQADAEPDDDEAVFNDVIKAAAQKSTDEDAVKSPESITPPSADQEKDLLATKSRHSGRQASISLQSKLRSTSFRDTAPGPASPGVTGLPRIEELEKENKRLARVAEEHEGRWRRVEEELEELREDNVNMGGEEVEKLKAELEVLKRQQRQNSGGSGTRGSRRESVVGGTGEESESIRRKELESKDSTISDMQLEISRLRSQLSSQTQGCETHGEQISALQASLSSTESKLRHVEMELSDAKKSLARASEKAMLDGTERTSKDTKIRSLEREMAAAIAQRDEVVKKADQLEKKVEAMNKLHREAEARNASKLSAAEQSAREVPSLKARIEKLESESTRLREKHKRVMSGGGGDEGLDELEDEERKKLERKIRDLEGQVFDLQRGVWRDKRVALQPAPDGSRTSLEHVGEDFDEVDLSGSGNASSRRRSLAANTLLSQGQGQGQKHSGFAQVLNSGLAAFRATTTSPDSQTQHQNRPRNDSLLQDFDDDNEGMFDEAAFAQAQREEEARKMVEHVREVKRGLKQWVGWRLDLVDARRGGGGGVGVGDVFEV